MYAVMGITGNVGGAVADILLEQGKQVRGIVRDEAKAQAWRDKGVEIGAGCGDQERDSGGEASAGGVSLVDRERKELGAA